MDLRPYQERAVGEVREAFRRARSVCLVAPTASGKTVLGLEVVRRTLARRPETRVLWLAHRAELVEQAERRGREYLDGAAAALRVETIQGLLSGRRPEAELLVLDECFPAGTLVDGRPIEAIRAGELVTSFSPETGETRALPVVRLFRRPATALVTLHFADGTTLVCTPNHKLWTPGGWRRADDTLGIDVMRLPSHHVGHGSGELPQLRDRIHPQPTICERSEAPPRRPNVLFSEVLLGLQGAPVLRDDGANEQEVRICPDEGAQPHAQAGGSRGGFAAPPGDRAQAPGSGRQRPWADCRGSNAVGSDATPTVHPANQSPGNRTPQPLQDRPGGSVGAPGHRDRRIQPHGLEPSGAGREEGGVLARSRVDRVEVHEPGRDGTFGGLCPDGHVYNLEVEGWHTYFADGVAVSNCHHYSVGAGEWHRIAQDYAGAWRLGLTATPQRSDGTPLGDVFGELVVAAQYSELLAGGWIVPCDVVAPARDLGSDLAQDPVEVWLAEAGDRRGFLFCGLVRLARDYAERLTARGVPAAAVSAETPAAEREASLAAFRAGRLRCLVNVYVLTEGVDVPDAEVCMLARGAGHAGSYLQMVGRVLRPAPGKARALLIDLCGSSHRHGPPCSDVLYSLDGAGIGSRRADRAEPGDGEGQPDPEIRRAELLRQRWEALADRVRPWNRDRPAAEKRAAWDGWAAEARQRGYRPGWARWRYRARYGESPPWAWVAEARRGA